MMLNPFLKLIKRSSSSWSGWEIFFPYAAWVSYDDKYWNTWPSKQWKYGSLSHCQKHILSLPEILPIHWTLRKFSPSLILKCFLFSCLHWNSPCYKNPSPDLVGMVSPSLPLDVIALDVMASADGTSLPCVTAAISPLCQLSQDLL